MSFRRWPLHLVAILLLSVALGSFTPLAAQGFEPDVMPADDLAVDDGAAYAREPITSDNSGFDPYALATNAPAAVEEPVVDTAPAPEMVAPAAGNLSDELAAADSSRAIGLNANSGGNAGSAASTFGSFFNGLRDTAGAAAESVGGAASWAGDTARRYFAGDPVTLSEEERTNLRNMRPVLVEMAGSDGLFNRADRPDIMSSLGCDIASRVDAGIRAESRSRGIIGKIVIAVGRNGIESREEDKAFGRVSSGLGQFFDGAGIEGQDGCGTGQTRNLSTYALEEGFTRGARTLEAIDARRNGNVKVVFPRGFGVADLDSIIADPNRRPPNGVIKMKPAKTEERVIRTCR